MVKSLYSGVSGLKTHQQRMDVIGNNIANVNTIGYKTDVVTFKDVYYQTKRSASAATSTLGGVNPRQVGYGVQMNTTSANMTQSGYTQSDNKFDMAINGNGFFQVMDGTGNIYYTRAGAFTLDDMGYLVNADGYHVLGVNGDSTGQEASSEIIRAVVPNTNAHVSSSTKRIAGTNVTLSVSAPSDYSDMTVTFTDSEYPFASYANNILTIFFNRDTQYNSEQDFEDAIALALQTGGVNLPDDVELQFDFEEIPADTAAVAAKNSVTGLRFSTTNASCQLHYAYAKQGSTANDQHAYIGFSVNDNTNNDKVTIVNGGESGKVTAAYTPGAAGAAGSWTLTLFENSTAQDINDAIKLFIKDNPTVDVPELKCTSYIIPSGAVRADVLDAWAGDTNNTLAGVPSSSAESGAFDLEVLTAGAFGNNYQINFAYLNGYDKTKAVWDENTLTVSICANSTIADVNKAIFDAANGNEKKYIKFNDIAGLEYGDGYDGSAATLNPDGTVATPPTPKLDAGISVWNPGIREAYFGGNPSVRPTDGDDSFFTKVAKSLSTFALEDGRTGSEQFLKDIDITIQQDGKIIGKHPIHGYIDIGRIDIAMFDNVNGLEKVGGTLFGQTEASGDVKLSVAGENNAGVVLSGSLEMSNVDLADEFTNMITTQRGYQANSRVITVSDTMLEELLSLKR